MRHRLAWAPKDQELRLVRVHEKSFVIKVELQSAKVILKLSQHDREVRSNDEKGDVVGIELPHVDYYLYCTALCAYMHLRPCGCN